MKQIMAVMGQTSDPVAVVDRKDHRLRHEQLRSWTGEIIVDGPVGER